jgi:hypothetical protein
MAMSSGRRSRNKLVPCIRSDVASFYSYIVFEMAGCPLPSTSHEQGSYCAVAMQCDTPSAKYVSDLPMWFISVRRLGTGLTPSTGGAFGG